ncbi:uncharacterized protein At3g61260 [Diospyros lotus]|uniref:uncharacterized protein At3g61260 n=1 Tax=Diospyros lotus TaxID=55363 RepID=UPI00224F726A|nr:uncharacterized protein At3g61260 [Diospyros lotus]
MESLIRQTWQKHGGAGQTTKEEDGSIVGRKIPAERAQSFKAEKKKTLNWFQGRQFSRQVSQEYNYINGTEHSAAVAAAAFAIHSLQELSMRDENKRPDGLVPSFTKTKSSKSEDTKNRVLESGKASKRFSAEDSKNRAPETGETSMKSSAPSKVAPVTKAASGKVAGKAVSPTPSFKQAPSFTGTASKAPESALPIPPSPRQSATSLPPTDLKSQDSKRSGMDDDTRADVWEKTELTKINERYEKLKTTIREWETKKKEKAKRRLERTERQVERKKTKASEHYRSEMKRVEEIARGALAQAEEHKRNEELKVKDKANKIRLTGRIPAACLCF